MSGLQTGLAFMLALSMVAPLSARDADPLADQVSTAAAPGVQRAVCDAAVITGKVRYVSLSGNDATADGSLARPYRTLSRVAEVVQANESIVVRGGTYLEPNEVQFRVPGVTLRSFPGEWAVIDRSSNTDQNSGVNFYVGADDGVLTCIEVIGGFYVVSTETKWDWGDPNDRAGVSRVRIEHARLHGSYADVIKIKPNSDDILIRHNEIFDSGVGQPVDDCNAEGIDNVNGDRTQVAYNHIHDICSTGVYLKGGATDGVIEYNLIERTGAAGILLGFDTSPEYFDLTVNPDYYENIRGIARYNLIRETGWAGIGFYASKDAQAYNNTILDAANQYHSPLYFGLSYQDWDDKAGRPPNLNPSFLRNVISQSSAVTTDPPLVDIRYSLDLGGMSALTGKPIMSDNCYDRQAGAAGFRDQRTGGGEPWVGNLAAWQTHIGGDARSHDVDLQLDASFQPQNPLCAGRGHLWNTATYTIAVSASPVQGGTVSGGGVYPAGVTATLRATPRTGWTFTNWTQNAQVVSTSAQYAFTVQANRTLVAGFAPRRYSLSVSKAGPGTVTSKPAGIDCGTQCQASFNHGTSVTLTPVPAAGATFAGWKGACTNTTGPCVVRMTAKTTVTATFTGNSSVDLLVTGISLNPVSPGAKGTFTARVTVKNQGTLGADGGYLDLWSNQSTAQSCGAMSESWAAIGRLEAGQSKTLAIRFRAGRAGTKTFRAFVDSWCETPESREGNNQLGKTYTVK